MLYSTVRIYTDQFGYVWKQQGNQKTCDSLATANIVDNEATLVFRDEGEHTAVAVAAAVCAAVASVSTFIVVAADAAARVATAIAVAVAVGVVAGTADLFVAWNTILNVVVGSD